MRKKTWLIIAAVLLMAMGFGAYYIVARAPIFTGYAAKNLASGIFVAGRSEAELLDQDLNFSLVAWANTEVDYKNKRVNADFFGFGKQTAVYREGLGVYLIESDLYPDAEAQSQVLLNVPLGFDTIAWPRGNKNSLSLDEVFDMEKLNRAMNGAFEKGATRSVLIAYDTVGFVEQYAKGFDAETKQLGWSMSKSIASALVGILEREKGFDINAPAPIAEWKNDERSKIPTRSLLNMTSGLKWTEDYGDISEATIMLYQRTNHAQYAIDCPFQESFDSKFYYTSGSSNILTEIVKRQLGNQEAYWQFPYQRLFNRIGMFQTVYESDGSGNFVGSSYTYATTRDWARFGLLYLYNGIWFGDTVLNPSWVNFTHQAAPNSNGDYGAQFWLNQSKLELPDAPADIYFADGFHGQRVYICPSKKLVIVRLGLTKNKDFDYNKFVTEVLASLKNKETIGIKP